MSQQENNFSRREMLGMTAGLVLRRRAFAGVAAILMGASLVFTLSTSAHNINLENAKSMAREYARSVLNAGGNRGYVQAITKCVKAFPGHNHYVRCTIQYEDRASKEADGVFACTETIEVYLQSHRDSQSFNKYMKHTSRPCGSERLSGPNP